MTELSGALATGVLGSSSKYGVSPHSLTSAYDPCTSAMMESPAAITACGKYCAHGPVMQGAYIPAPRLKRESGHHSYYSIEIL